MYTNLKEILLEQLTVDDNLWSEIIDCAVVQNLKKGEKLLHSGEICQFGYFIDQGTFMHTYVSEDGKSHVLAFHIDSLYPYITSPKSYFSKQKSNYEITALEPGRVLAFRKYDLDILSAKYPKFGNYYHKLAINGFMFFSDYCTMKLSASNSEVIEKIYTTFPELILRIPDKYLAQYVGITVEWFCKLKKRVLTKG